MKKNLNIIYAKSPQDVEDIVNKKNLSTIFFSTHSSKNIHILRFNNLKHIYIGNKSNEFIKYNKSFRAYDEIWVPNEASIDYIYKTFEKRHLIIKNIGTIIENHNISILENIRTFNSLNLIKFKLDKNIIISYKDYLIVHRKNFSPKLFSTNKKIVIYNPNNISLYSTKFIKQIQSLNEIKSLNFNINTIQAKEYYLGNFKLNNFKKEVLDVLSI
ncbi:hypothetical protein C6V80_09725 [Caminibacter pacificus]|uniref:Uncharacterized protein n=1 Tax=Caminibacter pacificus TaxID=1424653 RepID=A0ABX5VXS4_9BACT|nr:hypothetical protein [Caminibacter pacificus]QDD68120.1 hypothetical protein C6V80_09725 [Caminibacter pacificus]